MTTIKTLTLFYLIALSGINLHASTVLFQQTLLREGTIADVNVSAICKILQEIDGWQSNNLNSGLRGKIDKAALKADEACRGLLKLKGIKRRQALRSVLKRLKNYMRDEFEKNIFGLRAKNDINDCLSSKEVVDAFNPVIYQLKPPFLWTPEGQLFVSTCAVGLIGLSYKYGVFSSSKSITC